jgi:hypothetical protein
MSATETVSNVLPFVVPQLSAQQRASDLMEHLAALCGLPPSVISRWIVRASEDVQWQTVRGLPREDAHEAAAEVLLAKLMRTYSGKTRGQGTQHDLVFALTLALLSSLVDLLEEARRAAALDTRELGSDFVRPLQDVVDKMVAEHGRTTQPSLPDFED